MDAIAEARYRACTFSMHTSGLAVPTPCAWSYRVQGSHPSRSWVASLLSTSYSDIMLLSGITAWRPGCRHCLTFGIYLDLTLLTERSLTIWLRCSECRAFTRLPMILGCTCDWGGLVLRRCHHADWSDWLYRFRV